MKFLATLIAWLQTRWRDNSYTSGSFW